MDLSNYVFGESADIIETVSSDDVREATLALAQQAKRSLNIFTLQLDNRIYNNTALYEAMKQLATYSRYSLIRILIKDSSLVTKQGNRLVDLSQRISSRIQFRKPAGEHWNFNEEFVVADECGLMHRRIPKRYQGDLCFNAAMKARHLNKLFEECWQQSAPDPELRRLHL